MQGEVKTIVRTVYWDWKVNGWAYKWIFATRDEKFFVHANSNSSKEGSFVRVMIWNDHGWVEVYSIDAPRMKSTLDAHDSATPDPARFEPDVGDAISVAFAIVGLR